MFSLMVWAGYSPWYTVYGPVKRYNLIQMTFWTLSMLLRGFVKDEHLLSLPQAGRTEAGLQQPPSSLVYKYTSAAVVSQGEQQHWEGDLLCSANRLRGKVSLQHLWHALQVSKQGTNAKGVSWPYPGFSLIGSKKKSRNFTHKSWLVGWLLFETQWFQRWGTAWVRKESDWCDKKERRRSSGLCNAESGCRVWIQRTEWETGL